MNEPVLLRPHHALCLHYFIGKGYGCGFVENMFHIKRFLCGRSLRTVVLHNGADCICAACPNRRNGGCMSSEKVARYDRECLKACGLAFGQAFPWPELCRRVRKAILEKPGVRAGICFDCLWKTLCQQQDVEKSVENV
ncbi:MAG: DUF1284 domain-containing protein [Oscillospiraceae bacterium]|jgi:hypothetical protein|nr:DUF1284 domain-containing protein [Oscillospiraceae bacterium]MCI1989826.1 DUF1284 domain-containing protein [Oscillospiraceae bacterium]MCI2035532.1 DUF1284 domain-containing protein [Oscillospiraceae bacterium]